MTDPDMGYWTYQYDKSGNLELQTDAKGQKIRFLYDCLNRVYEKRYGDPTPISTVFYTYDDPTVPNSKGKPTKVSYQPSGEELREDRVLEYDLLQRVKSSKKKIGADEVTYERLYDSLGRVITLTTYGIPSQKTFSYEYDVAGNLLYVSEGGTHYVDYSGFTALGQPANAAFSNTVTTAYGYYPKTGRLNTLGTNKSGTPYQNLSYQYDQKGNISILTDSVNNITHSYTYDSLDRLTEANGGGAYPTQSYTYDRIGNILFKTDVGTYSYSNYSVKPHAVQSAGPFTFTYDANGNMTSKAGGGVNITINPQDWNYDNKPTRIQNGSNVINLIYDGNGQRVRKTSSNPTVLYFGDAYEKRGGVEVFHVFAGSRRIVSLRSDGKNQFYHPNHLGSASVITDQSGDWKEKIEYYPFGSYCEDIKNPNDPTFPDANYTFTGQEDDDDLGLYNYKARLYDPILGKFISPDSLVPYPTNPQTLNRYAYCLNNPLIYIDPSGEIFGIDDLLASMIIGAVIGAAMGAITAAINHQNILQGALIGAASGAISAAVGYGVGGAVTNLLTNVWGPTSVANIVGAMAGGFAGGAVGGAYTAMAYGGNVWKGALYGGLIGAAVAGLVRGAIEVNKWANSSGTLENSTSDYVMTRELPSGDCPLTPEQTRLSKWLHDLSYNNPQGVRGYYATFEGDAFTGEIIPGSGKNVTFPLDPPKGATVEIHTHVLTPEDARLGYDIAPNPSPKDLTLYSRPEAFGMDHYIIDYRGIIRVLSDETWYKCTGYKD